MTIVDELFDSRFSVDHYEEKLMQGRNVIAGVDMHAGDE